MAQRNASEPLDLFLRKVNKGGPIPTSAPELGPCWLWTGAIIKATGYGWFGYGGRLAAVRTTAHRFSYEHYRGPIPAAHVVDHLCANRACCNPDHLEAVTVSENLRRAPRVRAAQCKWGHALAGENLRLDAKGRAVCRECNRRRGAEFRSRWGRVSAADRSRTCPMCGSEFDAESHRRVHCSPTCARRSKSDPGYYKALALGVPAVRLRPGEIFARDSWTCGICGEPVDPVLRYPDPMSVSMDHIVPLSAGGEHSAENVQTAHLSCNKRKSAN